MHRAARATVESRTLASAVNRERFARSEKPAAGLPTSIILRVKIRNLIEVFRLAARAVRACCIVVIGSETARAFFELHECVFWVLFADSGSWPSSPFRANERVNG